MATLTVSNQPHKMSHAFSPMAYPDVHISLLKFALYWANNV